MVRPLTKLTGKTQQWEWGEAQQTAYDNVKAALTAPGVVIKRLRYDMPIKLVHGLVEGRDQRSASTGR